MKNRALLAASLLALGALTAGCSSECDKVGPGSHGGACLAGGVCKVGLICITGVCVSPPEGGLCSTGHCPDAAPCATCKDAGPCPTCKDAGACKDAAPCPTCKDAGTCKDAAPCPTCKDAGACKDAAPCPTCKDAAPCPTCKDAGQCKDAAPCPKCPDQGGAKLDAALPLSITWGAIPDMQDKHAEGAALVVGGKIYVLGPFGSSTIKREVFDIAQNKWSAMGNLPSGFNNDLGMRTAVVLNGLIHTVNGHQWYTPYPDHYAFNPGTSSWTKKASYPITVGKSCGARFGGKFYVVGGQNPVNSSNTVGNLYVYDPGTDKWTAGAPMPTKRADLACAFVGAKLFAVSGYNAANKPITALEEYDPQTNKWISRAGIPKPIYEAGNAAHEVNGRLVVIGGINIINKHTNAVQIYDPGTYGWSVGTPIKIARGAHAVAYVGNKVYVVGGYGGGWRKDVEVGTVK